MHIVYKCEFCRAQNKEEVFNRGIIISTCWNCKNKFTIEVKITPRKTGKGVGTC